MLRPAPEPQEVSPVPPPTAPSLGAPGVATVPHDAPAPAPRARRSILDQLPTEAETAAEVSEVKPSRKTRAEHDGGQAEGHGRRCAQALRATAKPKTWKSDPGF